MAKRTRSFNSPSDFIEALQKEASKEHLVYDGTYRLVTTYQTFWNSLDGELALRTDYQYDSTSARITGRKETISAWDEAWDF